MPIVSTLDFLLKHTECGSDAFVAISARIVCKPFEESHNLPMNTADVAGVDEITMIASTWDKLDVKIHSAVFVMLSGGAVVKDLAKLMLDQGANWINDAPEFASVLPKNVWIPPAARSWPILVIMFQLGEEDAGSCAKEWCEKSIDEEGVVDWTAVSLSQLVWKENCLCSVKHWNGGEAEIPTSEIGSGALDVRLRPERYQGRVYGGRVLALGKRLLRARYGPEGTGFGQVA